MKATGPVVGYIKPLERTTEAETKKIKQFAKTQIIEAINIIAIICILCILPSIFIQTKAINIILKD